MKLTKEGLMAGGVPADVAAKWVDPINQILTDYNFTDNREIASFIATVVHETGGFKSLAENLNYSAQSLANTWPNRYAVSMSRPYRPNALANKLNRNPQAIANNCYANRMGNGNEASGDGWRYRGRGPIQSTGKNAAIALNKTIGRKYNIDLVKNFDLLQQPLYGMASAAQYWIENVRPQLNKRVNPNTNNKTYMDICSDFVNIGHYTPAVGDAIGFNDRFDRQQKYLKVFGSLNATAPKPTIPLTPQKPDLGVPVKDNVLYGEPTKDLKWTPDK